MDKHYLSEITDPAERLRILRDNYDDRETTSYIKPLTQEELEAKNEQLAENCIETYRLQEELNEIKKGYNAKIDPLKTQNKQLCQQIKSRQEEVEGTLYHVNNHNTGYRETFDEQGELIGTRKLRPDEKQAKLPYIAAAANDQ